ncbi:MAG: peptidylprolyl isomerase [Mariprofundus sp.]|nr:peptidylprolyl isomerase [Mariprofundus sp.]
MKRFFILSALVSALLLQSIPTALAGQVQVKMITTLGTIELELYQDKAPKSVANFLRYAKQGLYDGTIFHRVMPNFMIQGGGYDQDMNKKSTFSPIINEADNGLPNNVGTIAMARTSSPHSASNQFFINTSTNSFLNHRGKSDGEWGYAVFGRVTHGMNVVRQIEAVQTGQRNGMKNVPVMPVFIQQVKITEWADTALPGPRKH